MDASRDRGPPSRPPTFEPLRAASPGWLAVVLVAGPVLWAASLIVVAYALRYTEVVEIALGVVIVSFLVAIVLLVPMRIRRVREEENP